MHMQELARRKVGGRRTRHKAEGIAKPREAGNNKASTPNCSICCSQQSRWHQEQKKSNYEALAEKEHRGPCIHIKNTDLKQTTRYFSGKSRFIQDEHRFGVCNHGEPRAYTLKGRKFVERGKGSWRGYSKQSPQLFFFFFFFF